MFRNIVIYRRLTIISINMVKWWFKWNPQILAKVMYWGAWRTLFFSGSITTVINKLSYKHVTQYNFGNLTATYCFMGLHSRNVVTWKGKERSSTIHPKLKHGILKRLVDFNRQKDASNKFLELFFWLIMNGELMEKVWGCKFCIFKKRYHYHFCISDKKLPEWLQKDYFWFIIDKTIAIGYLLKDIT